jgi:pyridoxamine 5'-phosphate oxidase
MTESNPLTLFARLYERMHELGVEEPAAATLATATPEGKPSARIVLLKSFDEAGFVFYTNLQSQKSVELKSNPYAALCFYWEPIHYQVRIAGRAAAVSEAEADEYFAGRPRGSQIGAWISKQSSTLQRQAELEERFRQFEREYDGREIPRPEFWSGFRVIPNKIEFWKRGVNRLHGRTLYLRKDKEWAISLLCP